jgi:ATP-dependent Clp protease protease subunit
MTTINLHGVVGWDIDAKAFSETLDNTTGDILLDLNSGGGYITDGVAIYNKIRAYDKGEITTRVSYAASMMSQIALAGDKVQVYPNSIFMMHNAQGGAYGDYREMDKRSKLLKSMTNMLAKTYEKKSGKEANEVLQMMNDDTYLFGQEIIDQGLADVILDDSESDENRTKDEAIAYASLQLEAVNKALKEENVSIEELSACIGGCNLENLVYNNAPEAPTRNQQGGDNGPSTNSNKGDEMKISELRAQHPELYAEVVETGVNQERERVTAHLTMGEASGDMELAVASINSGADMNASINAKYMAAHMKRNELNNRQDENVDGLDNGDAGDGGDDEDAEDAKALEKALNGEI